MTASSLGFGIEALGRVLSNSVLTSRRQTAVMKKKKWLTCKEAEGWSCLCC